MGAVRIFMGNGAPGGAVEGGEASSRRVRASGGMALCEFGPLGCC